MLKKNKTTKKTESRTKTVRSFQSLCKAKQAIFSRLSYLKSANSSIKPISTRMSPKVLWRGAQKLWPSSKRGPKKFWPAPNGHPKKRGDLIEMECDFYDLFFVLYGPNIDN